MPAEKISDEIAAIRGIEQGKDSLSPNRHREVRSFGDLLDFFFGRRFGRTKVIPGVSAKTWEGMICGVTCAALIGGLLSWLTPFSFLAAMGLALSTAVVWGIVVFVVVAAAAVCCCCFFCGCCMCV